MKKWWILLFAAVILSRTERSATQIEQLEPVEVLMVTVQDEEVCILTDTGAHGVGPDLDRAVENLHASASAAVFLETARYLLVDEEGQTLLEPLYPMLRPACRVCRIETDVDLAEAVGFLRAHPPETRLIDWVSGETELPTLYHREGRGQLVQ